MMSEILSLCVQNRKVGWVGMQVDKPQRNCLKGMSNLENYLVQIGIVLVPPVQYCTLR